MAKIQLNNFLIILLSLIISIVPLVSSGDSHHWSYTSQNEWPKLCATGSQQSPINIDSHNVWVNTTIAIDFKHYETEFPTIKISNNGHTAVLTIDWSSDETTQPYITGPALANELYSMAQLHFHWSDNKGRGAEHTINDRPYSMEMHIVHFNRKYDNISEAINHKDGLAVLAVLFAITRKENPHLYAIIEGIKAVKIEGLAEYQSAAPSERIPALRLENLLPNDLTFFYRYKGSLTTPPCSESVIWLVFHETNEIGLKQIQTFRDLVNSHKTPLGDTFRQLQPLNSRRIESSKQIMASDGIQLTSSQVLTQFLLTMSSLVFILRSKY